LDPISNWVAISTADARVTRELPERRLGLTFICVCLYRILAEAHRTPS
jgi:hypothetical protein